jgi:mRNA interferase MazF
MKRGQVWWANHLPVAGRRPVRILSHHSMPVSHGEITVAYLTSTRRNPPEEMLLTRADGVYKTCVVNLDTINTIPKANLNYFICSLSRAKILEVNEAIVEALDLK